jgi:hypothetical protein
LLSEEKVQGFGLKLVKIAAKTLIIFSDTSIEI